jgi:PAS domain S-box-containing protein
MPKTAVYQITEIIYQGSKTTLYRGLRRLDQTPVLIKALNASDPPISDIEKLKHEFKITQILTQKNTFSGILKSYNLEQSLELAQGQNRMALVLEDFGGEPLLQFSPPSKKTQGLGAKEFLSIAIQLAKTLERLHQYQIIHKAIAPHNILINPQTGEVKLTHFAIASQLPQDILTLQQSDSLESHVAYLSPEQVGSLHHVVDYRTDFYSLGVTFYELLTGCLPYVAEDPLELVQSHLTKQPLPPHLISRLCSKAVSEMMIKLISMNPDDRYQSAWDITADLETGWRQLESTAQIEPCPQFFPRIARIDPPRSLPKSSTGLLADDLDLVAILKASQAIAGEIILDQLLRKLIAIAIENAGATKGFLILLQEGELRLEVAGTRQDDTVNISLSSLPLEVVLPAAIVQHVAATGLDIVLADAAREGLFSTDPFVKQHNLRSVLCLPILYQTDLLGLLYLENPLRIGAFTSHCLEMLKLLSAQAAVSIENARFYQSLEHKVEERTAQLAQANAALQESEAELRGLFAAMDDVILVFDQQGCCLKVAPTASSSFYIPAQEQIGKTVHEVLPKALADFQLDAIQQALATQETLNVEYDLIIHGHKKYSLARVAPLSENTVLWVSRDVTDRKQIEEALRLSEIKYRNLFENSQVGMGQTRLADGLILDANQRCAEILGFSTAADLIGQKLTSDFYCNPDDRQQLLVELAQNDEVRDFELKLRRPDGSIFWSLLSLKLNAEESCLEFIVADISDRRRAEIAQQEQLHLLQVIIDAMPLSIFYKDTQGIYLGCNKAFLELRGMTSEQIVGKSVYETAPPHMAEVYAETDQAVFDSRGIQTYESSVAYADGSQHDVICYKAAFLNRAGDLDGLVGAILDITDRKRAETALQVSLDQLAIAHEEIQLLNQRLETENLRLSAEVFVARRLQQMILPKAREIEKIEELEIAGFMEPTNEVGGDYYDVLYYDNAVKICIGDVTGHGLESGVLMIMVQTTVRTLLVNHEIDPRRFFNAINQVIYENAQRINSDKTLSLVLLDYQAGCVKISGQHEEVLVVRSGGQIERIDTINLGFFIGLVPDISDLIEQVEVQLQPGDGIVLYTDGVTEAENSRQEYYGLERLCRVVSQSWQRSAAQIREAAVEDVRSHVGQHRVYDDITLLVLKQR